MERVVPPFALDRPCPYCGGTVAPNFAYCTHCANLMPPVDAPEPEATPPAGDERARESDESRSE
jgi:hypothetical protein